MKRHKFIFALLLVIFLSAVLADNANAIPTFARKYRTSCTTCHIGFNKLNIFGKAYRLNGYNIPEGDAAYVKEEPSSLGAPAWARVWPDTVWPGTIPGAVPISFMVHQRVNVRQDNDTAAVDFDMPHEFELFVGGTFDDFASFFGEFVLFEDGEVEGLKRLFVQFNDIFYMHFGNWLSENALNIKIGRFYVAAEPFHTATRRTLATLRVNDFNVGTNKWNFNDIQSGIEANGIVAKRVRYAAGVVNGNGATADDNNHKDVYYRLSYKHGGMAFDGSGAEELEDELVETENWVDNSVTLGTFGYFGLTGTNNRFFRVGGDLRASYGNLEVYGAGVYGEDNDVVATADVTSNSFVWFIGGDYVIFPWLMTSLRYEDENIEAGDDDADIERFVANLIMYPRANIRLLAEFHYYPEFNGDSDGNNLFMIDLAYLF